uniref:RxLR effector candidate protein n=1 Tax=Hyaloperonospora arabidopsidis (strain Emoy2) TaxID=559515 RepID=M4B5C4_HYAAE|nr:RxLR effector candidate protein [Hyaloperonospora arabidopsidis Emoy2]
MRVYPPVLLAAAAAIVTRTASSSRSKKTDANPAHPDRSGVNTNDSVPVDQLSKTLEIASKEERMPGELLIVLDPVEAGVQRFVGSLNPNHLEHDLTEASWVKLKDLDTHAVMRYMDSNPENLERAVKAINALSAAGRSTPPSTMIQDIQDFEKLHLEKAMNFQNDPKLKTWQAYGLLKDNGYVDTFDHISLRVLQDHVEMLSRKEGKKLDLVDALSLRFGKVAELAPVLSIAKKSRIYGEEAKHSQQLLLDSCLKNEMSIDDMFDLLELSNLKERGLTYENLDTLDTYIALHNKKYPGKKTDTIKYLQFKIGDGELASMTIDWEEKSSYAKTFGDELFMRWKKEKKDVAGDCVLFLTRLDWDRLRYEGY